MRDEPRQIEKDDHLVDDKPNVVHLLLVRTIDDNGNQVGGTNGCKGKKRVLDELSNGKGERQR